MTNKIAEFTGTKVFQQNQELFDRLNEVITEFNGKISVAEAIGVLEMLKANLLKP